MDFYVFNATRAIVSNWLHSAASAEVFVRAAGAKRMVESVIFFLLFQHLYRAS